MDDVTPGRIKSLRIHRLKNGPDHRFAFSPSNFTKCKPVDSRTIKSLAASRLDRIALKPPIQSLTQGLRRPLTFAAAVASPLFGFARRSVRLRGWRARRIF